MQNRKSRSMGGSDPFSFTSDSDAPIKIHCKTEAKMQSPWPEGSTLKADRPKVTNVSRIVRRLESFLEGGRLQGVRIHCKYAADLFCERPRGRGSEDGTFSVSWTALWCPQGPKKVVEQISEIQKVAKWRMHSKPRPRSLHIYNGS